MTGPSTFFIFNFLLLLLLLLLFVTNHNTLTICFAKIKCTWITVNVFQRTTQAIDNFLNQHRFSLCCSSGGNIRVCQLCSKHSNRRSLSLWRNLTSCSSLTPSGSKLSWWPDHQPLKDEHHLANRMGECSHWCFGGHEVGVLVPAAPSKRYQPWIPLPQTVFWLP